MVLNVIFFVGTSTTLRDPVTCVSSARHRPNGTQDFRGRVPRFLEDLEFGVDKTCAVLLAYN